MPKAVPLPEVSPLNDLTLYVRLVKEVDDLARETEYTDADGQPQAFLSTSKAPTATPVSPALVVDGVYLPKSRVWRFGFDRTVMTEAALAPFAASTPYIMLDQPGNSLTHVQCVYVPEKAATLVALL